MYCKLKSGKRCQCFFFEIVIATSDRKIVQMTSSTTVPFLASFSPPTSHGQASPLCICLDCACSLAWTHFWCTVQLILIFLSNSYRKVTNSSPAPFLDYIEFLISVVQVKINLVLVVKIRCPKRW